MDKTYTFPLADFQSDGTLRFAEGPTEILLVRVEGQIRAYRGVCPHLGGPMLACQRTGDALVCPWHEYSFRAEDGVCQTIPGSKWRHSRGVPQAQTEPLPIRLTPMACEIRGDSVMVTVKA